MNTFDALNQQKMNIRCQHVRNPIYQKLQKIFYSQHRKTPYEVRLPQHDTILRQNQSSHQLKPIQHHQFIIEGLDSKNQPFYSQNIGQAFNDPIEYDKAITLSLSTQNESRTFIKSKQAELPQEIYQRDLNIQNHPLSNAQKPYLYYKSIIFNDADVKNAFNNNQYKQIDLINEIKQSNDIKKQKFSQTKKSFLDQNLIVNKESFNQLQEKLYYYEKMEQFYLEQINEYRSDKKLLEWKLKIIVEQLLENKKQPRNCVSEALFHDFYPYHVMSQCLSVSELKINQNFNDLDSNQSSPQSIKQRSGVSKGCKNFSSQSISCELTSNLKKGQQSVQNSSQRYFSQYQMRTVSPSSSQERVDRKNPVVSENVCTFQTNYYIEPIDCFSGLDSKIEKQVFSEEKYSTNQRQISPQKSKLQVDFVQNIKKFKDFKLNLEEVILVESDQQDDEKYDRALKNIDLNVESKGQRLSKSPFDSVKCFNFEKKYP